MVAAITASIELATFADPNLSYTPQHAILSRAKTTLRCKVPFTNPATGDEESSDLIPDAVFGLEYRQGGRSSFRFFAIEADRATEPTRATKFNRKSHLRNFLQYREYVGGGLYREHLKLTSGLLALNVTTSEATMANMLKLTSELSPSGTPTSCSNAIRSSGGNSSHRSRCRHFLLAPGHERAAMLFESSTRVRTH